MQRNIIIRWAGPAILQLMIPQIVIRIERMGVLVLP